jgi:hypothetical protein
VTFKHSLCTGQRYFHLWLVTKTLARDFTNQQPRVRARGQRGTHLSAQYFQFSCYRYYNVQLPHSEVNHNHRSESTALALDDHVL